MLLDLLDLLDASETLGIPVFQNFTDGISMAFTAHETASGFTHFRAAKREQFGKLLSLPTHLHKNDVW